MNVQGQPSDSALHIKVGKNLAASHRVPQNQIEVDIDQWILALSGESCPHKHSVGRPLTLFETRTCSEQAVERTRRAAGRIGLAGKGSAGTECRGPGQCRIDGHVPPVGLLCWYTRR